MLLKQKKNLDMAMEMAESGIARLEKRLKNPEKNKFPEMTSEEWRAQMSEFGLARLIHTKGQILRAEGKNEEALPVLEEASALSGGKDPAVNETYAKALVDMGQHEKARELLEENIKQGQTTADMKDLLKTAYIEVKGKAEGFESYFNELDDVATPKLRAELEKEMEDSPAPDFSLEDLNGNTVTLADLKGKTLVLDFWATWCGPCISSFPAMNRAREIFEADDTVEFLFINTLQKEENKKSNAQNFISKNNFSFHVLLDLDDAVVNAFKVRGIPTKFIVDKNGRIRFTKIGFDGNDDKTVKELKLMIEMVK
jgi:peroxiredoxin